MSEHTAKSLKTLEILRKRYRDRFITPLVEFFTKPPLLYDSHQIRLRKQMERELESLEKTILCPTCLGRGIVMKKIDHFVDPAANWKNFLTSKNGDSRAVALDFCFECLGNGIVFLKKKNHIGSVLKEEDLFSIRCCLCDGNLDYIDCDATKNNTKAALYAKCSTCHVEFSLESLGYRISSAARSE